MKHSREREKLSVNGKLYEYTGFGDCNCPVCNHWQENAEYISKPYTVYFDVYEFNVYVKCNNCGKRYYYTDGN